MTAHQDVLFVGIRDAARSQMAAGILRALGGGYEVKSAGTTPAEFVDPLVMKAMLELDIVIGTEHPHEMVEEEVEGAKVVIAMDQSVECPYYLGTRYEEWHLEDLDGQSIETIRKVRDDIRARVEALRDSLT
ncbi:MAG: heat-shock protein HtpX [Aeromicrobium sp.]